MDYPFWGCNVTRNPHLLRRLNPYSNGLPSRGHHVHCPEEIHRDSLNPYSNGLPSRGQEDELLRQRQDGLNPYSNGLPSRGCTQKRTKANFCSRLNPYSNGLPSRGGGQYKALAKFRMS